MSYPISTGCSIDTDKTAKQIGCRGNEHLVHTIKRHTADKSNEKMKILTLEIHTQHNQIKPELCSMGWNLLFHDYQSLTLNCKTGSRDLQIVPLKVFAYEKTLLFSGNFSHTHFRKNSLLFLMIGCMKFVITRKTKGTGGLRGHFQQLVLYDHLTKNGNNNHLHRGKHRLFSSFLFFYLKLAATKGIISSMQECLSSLSLTAFHCLVYCLLQ